MMNEIINDIDKKEMDGRIINYKKINIKKWSGNFINFVNIIMKLD